MNSRYNEEPDLQDYQESTGEREISLNTATILGIFFLLALLCAIFFGFGYTMGRRTTSPAAAPIADTSSTLATNGSAKPAPGSAAPQLTRKAVDDDTTPTPPTIQQVAQPLEKPAAPTPEPPKAAPVAAAPAVAATTPDGPPAVVQVAAVSHQEDADTLVNALKRRGYSVVVRHEPQDKLLHIQIGPLASKKDAEAMRQRLLSDGYNAIVK
ncbi:sporulation related protein [Edaphobacter aggregans]|uniref:Sporulation related protein n=1 Tax=Edaphobacter aggregans TaxID=570835 RepID=A0A3R9Q914_9BACT|nr:SPOR domain-containing protein [Edaphobacter aggregans]RSL16149.1 sporulation related protein [Edaphobacter aggregans]